jgi:SAM-dependent methyltransferase
MQSSRSVSLSQAVFLLALSVTWSGALAQPGSDFQPQVGQHGKDVIWVPTPQSLVDKMLEIAKVTPQDYVVDLGSGDGRTVISAAKLGATALGIEYNPSMVELSKRNAAKAGFSGKATFMQADIFASDFSKATVVTMFLLPGLNLKLRPTLLNMKPGTRVVSNSFDMGDWQADQTARATTDCTGYCKAFLWIVPAKVDGTWRLGESELSLEQKYQFFTGKLTAGNVVAPITDGKLEADKITFTAGGARYTGQVKGATMEGTSISGAASAKEASWQATRK